MKVILAFLLVLVASGVEAAPINYYFQGRITEILSEPVWPGGPDLLVPVGIGDPVSGFFEYRPDLVPFTGYMNPDGTGNTSYDFAMFPWGLSAGGVGYQGNAGHYLVPKGSTDQYPAYGTATTPCTVAWSDGCNGMIRMLGWQGMWDPGQPLPNFATMLAMLVPTTLPYDYGDGYPLPPNLDGFQMEDLLVDGKYLAEVTWFAREPVPEPATLLLSAVGLGGAALWRRMRRVA